MPARKPVYRFQQQHRCSFLRMEFRRRNHFNGCFTCKDLFRLRNIYFPFNNPEFRGLSRYPEPLGNSESEPRCRFQYQQQRTMPAWKQLCHHQQQHRSQHIQLEFWRCQHIGCQRPFQNLYCRRNLYHTPGCLQCQWLQRYHEPHRNGSCTTSSRLHSKQQQPMPARKQFQFHEQQYRREYLRLELW